MVVGHGETDYNFLPNDDLVLLEVLNRVDDLDELLVNLHEITGVAHFALSESRNHYQQSQGGRQAGIPSSRVQL